MTVDYPGCFSYFPVMGLDDKIGNFKVGKEFDAILVNPKARGSPFDVFHSSYSDSIEVGQANAFNSFELIHISY